MKIFHILHLLWLRNLLCMTKLKFVMCDLNQIVSTFTFVFIFAFHDSKILFAGQDLFRQTVSGLMSFDLKTVLGPTKIE